MRKLRLSKRTLTVLTQLSTKIGSVVTTSLAWRQAREVVTTNLNCVSTDSETLQRAKANRPKANTFSLFIDADPCPL